MKTKPVLCPERLRQVPSQFSWIDHRLVRDRHIRGRSPCALAFYLFLCTVADAQGLSYYSDQTTENLLGFSSQELGSARGELVAAGLIAYRTPFYQVLSLEPERIPAKQPPERRQGQTQSAAEILRQIMSGP